MARHPIQVFVGTDQRQAFAERALANSIHANTELPVSIHWLRSGDPGLEIDRKKLGWPTEFSCFRFMVPELCGFRGRAIYLDSDMLVLGDIGELWDIDPAGSDCAIPEPGRPDVMLYDCAKFEGKPGWPSCAQILTQKGSVSLYRGRCTMARVIPPEWNHCDVLKPDSKLVHFTQMRTQPWRPWPERFPYDREHPDPAAVDLFWTYAQ